MHLNLSKSPLTYVLWQVRFSNIESIGSYIPKLQDKIRGAFPHFQKITIQTVQFREEQQPASTTLNQWHFIDKDKATGIILDDQSLTLHTTEYTHFSKLRENFETILNMFNDILKITLFTRIGLRYINLIENDLDKIDKGLKGFQLKTQGYETNKFLTKTETTQLNQLGIIKIQTTHIGSKEIIAGAKNLFVPPDLADIASLLNFKNKKDPEKDFLILDLDHFNEQQGDFNISNILNQSHSLQEMLYAAFCNAIGEEVLRTWE